MLSVCTLLACAAPPPQPGAQAPASSESTAAVAALSSNRTLVIALRVEPTTVSPKPFRQAGIEIGIVLRLFNAGLAITDEQDVPHPYLVEALPQLNTETWRVNADGTMETIYRLRPNLTWHDGRPLTAEDFVFSWNVFATPELGSASSPPLNQIEEVTASDSRTVVIRWKRSYPYAGQLQAADLPPLPRHLLESSFSSSQLDSFAALPYWTTEYVGPGPYRIERWEPGSFMEASAFDGHPLGRAKIEKMRLQFISDPNTVLANLLASSIHFAGTGAIYFQQATVMKREWGPTNAGKILVAPGGWRYVHVQLRPELADPRGLLDVRVRKALLHSVDKQALNEGLFEGQGIMGDTIVAPNVDYFPEVDRAITKYPYDLRATEQFMSQAGYTKGSDGMFASPSDGRFSTQLQVIAQTQNETEMSLMAAGWRQAGYDVRESVMPAAQAQSGEARAQFPGLFTSGGGNGEVLLANMASIGIPKPENRWTGSNRGAWSNVEYDRLFEAFNTTLERPQRTRQLVEMMKIVTAELPVFALFFQPSIAAHVAALNGPEYTGAGWDVHTWTLD
jgi:peptide/nickel transport system substrate-binding protein